MSFFNELKRRNVLRAGALYIGAAWALSQGMAQLLPVFDVSNWVVRWFVIAAIVGFPFAMLFSWFYEWTPRGIQRESEVASDASITRATGKKLDRWIIAVLSLAVVLLVADKVLLHKDAHDVATAAATSRSIAVLPFVNMSGDSKNDYFSDGITEEILNALAQSADLKVVARTSAFVFKGKDQDLRKVGEILGVATVLEGSVQRDGDDVRITAQLIDARNGLHLWSEKYDRKLTNIFAVEDEISKSIAEKLQLQLGGPHTDVAGTTSSTQAHDMYLRGLTLLAARGPGLRDAADAFRQAVKLDPDYAQAWGALAETELVSRSYGIGSAEAALPRAESAAQRALAINPDIASVQVAVANAHVARFEWPQADKAFRRALALAPGDAEAVDQYAQFLLTTGQLEPALREIDRARQLDPLSAIIGAARTASLMALHRDADATVQIEATLIAHPDFMLAPAIAALLDIQQQRYKQAETQLRDFARILGVDADAMALIARGMADPALRAAALRSLETAPATEFLRNDTLFHAAFLTALGDHERALDQLELYAAGHNNSFGGMLWIGSFDPLRTDPRFKALMKKMGLPYQPTVEKVP